MISLSRHPDHAAHAALFTGAGSVLSNTLAYLQLPLSETPLRERAQPCSPPPSRAPARSPGPPSQPTTLLFHIHTSVQTLSTHSPIDGSFPSFTALVHHTLAPTTRTVYIRQMALFSAWLGSRPSFSSMPFDPSSLLQASESYLLSLANPPRPSSARVFLASWAHFSLLGLLPLAPCTLVCRQRHHFHSPKSLPPPAMV
jgi:hypothetical protein